MLSFPGICRRRVMCADNAHMLFRAQSVGAIVVPRPSIADIRSGDRGRRFGGLMQNLSRIVTKWTKVPNFVYSFLGI